MEKLFSIKVYMTVCLYKTEKKLGKMCKAWEFRRNLIIRLIVNPNGRAFLIALIFVKLSDIYTIAAIHFSNIASVS